MHAVRAPFVGILVAMALLCVENVAANAYRAHRGAKHAHVDVDRASQIGHGCRRRM